MPTTTAARSTVIAMTVAPRFAAAIAARLFSSSKKQRF